MTFSDFGYGAKNRQYLHLWRLKGASLTIPERQINRFRAGRKTAGEGAITVQAVVVRGLATHIHAREATLLAVMMVIGRWPA